MRNYLLVIFLFLSILSRAQDISCGTTHHHHELQQRDPLIAQKAQSADRTMYERVLNASFEERDIVTIPLVFHIIHNNGPENLSDAEIQNVVTRLNQRFANEAPFYQPEGVNVPLRFCLASVDPFGQPTTGINRVQSPLTNMSYPNQVEETRMLSRWNSSLYINIWVVKDIQNFNPGFAVYPTEANTLYDGTFLEATVLDAALVHELGHLFYLFHTFDGGCRNFNCLLDGDHVCDTPPDASDDMSCMANSCSTEMNDTTGFNPFTQDMAELPNYMDYSSCWLTFTEGQKERMMAAYDVYRSTLTLSNGCGAHPNSAAPVASLQQSWECYGTRLFLEGANILGADWDFDSDGRIDACGLEVAPLVPTSGLYHVTVTVFGGSSYITLEEDIQIYVAPYQNYPMISGFSGAGYSAIYDQWSYCLGQTVVAQGEPNMTNYQWNTGQTTQNISFTPTGESFTLSLTATDANGLVWTSCFPIDVVAAPASIAPVISIDPNAALCTGNIVNIAIQPSPIVQNLNLIYSGGNIFPFNGSVLPWTLSEFQYFYIVQLDSNGCTTQSNYLNITAEASLFPQPLIINGLSVSYFNGLHIRWYRDDVLLEEYNDANTITMTETGCYRAYSWWGSEGCGAFSTDSACVEIVGIANTDTSNGWKIFPNPAKTEVNIQGPMSGNATVELLDVSGRRQIAQIHRTAQRCTLDITHLAPGAYIVRIRDNKGTQSLTFFKAAD